MEGNHNTEVGLSGGPVFILSRPLEYESLCWGNAPVGIVSVTLAGNMP